MTDHNTVDITLDERYHVVVTYQRRGVPLPNVVYRGHITERHAITLAKDLYWAFRQNGYHEKHGISYGRRMRELDEQIRKART